MAEGPSPEHARLIRKLETIATLSKADKHALAGIPLRLKAFQENTDLSREGEATTECCLVIDGLVCRYKVLGAGQRQIMSLHLPGDIPDLQSLHLGVLDHSLGSLTAGRAAYLPHAAVRDLTDRFPDITAALWRDSLIDASITREWLAGIGRRSAHQRLAHLICEVFVRSRALHLIEDKTFELSITQAELGDALGLSTVHVNRVLQDLRRDDLITWRGKSILVQDWERLRVAGDFDAGYLHLLDGAVSATLSEPSSKPSFAD
jgi:CRP-like cAMP-binding protein